MAGSIFDGTLKLYFRNDQGGVLQDGPAVEWNNAMTAIEQLAGAIPVSLPAGALVEQLPTGAVLPTSYTVWETAAKLVKLTEITWTYIVNTPLVATENVKGYTDNVLVYSYTDTFTYSNGVLSTITRAVP